MTKPYNYLNKRSLGIAGTMIFFGGTGFLSACMPEEEKKSPNLIVIMVDDMGHSDVGFNGCKDIPTPNMDRIAENGINFTSGYTTYSVSSPSRAGFITGRYPQRFGYERNVQYRPNDPNMGLSQDESTLAETLSKVGYYSGIIGKWHLGAHISNHPLNRGFNEFYGHLGGGHQFFPEALTIKDSYAINSENESYRTWIMRNHDHEPIDKYLTDEFSDEAVSFIERNKEKPFFLFLAYNAPHLPLQATEEYLSRFENIENPKRKTYAAMVSAVDDGVGRVLDKLEENQLDKNTLVFFLSDNGGPETKNASDNGALRGGKGDVFEGGYRVPFVMQWKGEITPGEFDHPVSSMDIFATIAALSNAPLNDEKPLDGVNIYPYLNGDQQGVPHDILFLRKFDQDKFTVRKGDYKLISSNKNKIKQLYHLGNDIGETTDLSEQNEEKTQELESLRAAWNEELIEPAFLGLIHTDAWKKKAKNKK
ncbi:MAG: sulfatase-like hydrolase/transferase [Bacteroidales bacterium]|nr:sulfatase-like hydrolase/transferase [Bacteroidales bacterium]